MNSDVFVLLESMNEFEKEDTMPIYKVRLLTRTRHSLKAHAKIQLNGYKQTRT